MKKRQEVYDLYWYFACERQNIFWKKINGESAPWTEDKILQEYKFCNSYRVNDRVSQYLLKEVIYNGKKYSDSSMLFRIILFKLFNKESTWELLLNNFEDIITCSKVNKSKDDPDFYLACAGVLKQKPKDIVVFEDADYCIDVARKAGFKVVKIKDWRDLDEKCIDDCGK